MRDLTDQQLVHKTIRDVAGEAGIRAMQDARGGMEILIPLDPKPDNWLSRTLGYEVAQEVSRRLTVIDADGRRTCNMKAYFSRTQTRLQELRTKIKEEILECLAAGMTVRNTALRVRITERDVTRERSSLIATGQLPPINRYGGFAPTVLPETRRPLALTALTSCLGSIDERKHSVDDKRQLWEIRNAIADDGLLKGHSTRKVSMAAEVSPSYVRIRRKLLLASGRLKPGRIGSGDMAPSRSPRSDRNVCSLIRPASPNHSANIGGMVAPTSREVTR